MASQPAVRVFISYSRHDRRDLDELLKHLSVLRDDGVTVFYDEELLAGDEWAKELTERFEASSVILLLVTASYLAGEYATREMTRALERARDRSALVIPIIARPCAWKATPIAELQLLPPYGRPVSEFKNRDKVWSEIVGAIREAIHKRWPETAATLKTKPEPKKPSSSSAPSPQSPTPSTAQQRPLAAYRFSEDVSKILRAATRLHPFVSGISTESILRATIAHGRVGNAASSHFLSGIASDDAASAPDLTFTDKIESEPSFAALRFTPNATRMMDIAYTAAVATTGTDVIRVRHLVFALLQPIATSMKDAMLERLGIGANATAAFVEYLRGSISSTNKMTAWERRLRGSEAGRVSAAFAPSYAADLAGGDDLLGFEADARALASLIASRDTKPPLSIGLFGDWGSGKSFFMRQIREFVADIAERAAASRGSSRKTLYHDRIVQIEFNAWHYIEGNLWASLVEHIFSNLRLRPDEERDDAALETKRLELLRLLEVEQQQEQQATQRSDEAKAAADKARQERTTKIERRIQIELGKTLDLTDAVDAATQEALGIEPGTLKKIGELRDRGRAYWELIGRVRAVVLLLRERNRGPTLALALAVPLVIAALGWGAHWIATHMNLAHVGALVTTFVTALTALTHRFAPWIARVGDVAKKVEEKHRELELRREKEAAAVDAEIAALSQRVEVAEAERSQATQRVQAIKEEIEHSKSSRIFEDFIEERAKSTDYRRHLGVLANVRRDFERMAYLLARGENAVAERIVLYIDDLDRCPSNRVVKVLEAIHLLLAFPLFVVVVGVDARWIARSLKLEYDALLADDGEDHSLGIEATPRDYLAKIFQVPFWIRAMSSTGCQNLIDGLTRSESILESTPEPAATVGETQPKSAPAAQAPSAPTITTAAQQEHHEVLLGDDLNPFALRVLQPEVELMKRLTALLGRSPRAVKRFVNCYRLIKIGLDPADIGAFLTDPKSNLHYKPTMFLLAMVTGMPELGEKMLDVLVEQDEKTLQDMQADALLQLLATEFGERFPDKRKIVSDHLLAVAMADPDAFSAAALRKAAPVVRRYSFRAGYAAAALQAPFETRNAPRADMAAMQQPSANEIDV